MNVSTIKSCTRDSKTENEHRKEREQVLLGCSEEVDLMGRCPRAHDDIRAVLPTPRRRPNHDWGSCMANLNMPAGRAGIDGF